VKHVASLKYGVIFKKAFCDPEIFTAFVRDIIGVPVEIIHKLFDTIRRYHISPEERAGMIDEFHQEELMQKKLEERKIIRQTEIAAGMLKKGIAADIIAELTGLSEEELVFLEKSRGQ
jgi:hypothetical protein